MRVDDGHIACAARATARSTTAAIDARKIDAFARLMGDKLEERVGWAEPILQATPRILSQGLRHTCLMSRNGDWTSNLGSMLELIQPAT